MPPDLYPRVGDTHFRAWEHIEYYQYQLQVRYLVTEHIVRRFNRAVDKTGESQITTA
jgi:hypothetical protein